MYSKPLGGICFATALFICAPDTGAPVAPSALPVSVDGTVRVDGSSTPGALSVGQQVTLTASGFAPSANVTFALYSSPTVLDEVVADASGVATARVATPALLGSHTIVALGNDSESDSHVMATPVTVKAPSSLPATGIFVGLQIAAALALMLLGLGAARLATVGRRVAVTR